MFNFWRINKKVEFTKDNEILGSLSSKNVKEVLGDSSDIIVKKVYINNDKDFNITAFGIDGMVDTNIVDNFILKPLASNEKVLRAKNEKELFNLVTDGIIYHFDQKIVEDLSKAVDSILKGLTVLVFDSLKKAVVFDAKKLAGRSITTPPNESALLGSQEAFVENIRVNTSLIRKKVKSVSLRFFDITVGITTKTSIQVVYLTNITDKDILNKVISRIEKIKSEDVISSNILKNAINDNKYSFFPQVLFTERVDKFCSNILDGKVGILVDGLPVGYIVPGVFNMFFQAPEDYDENYFISSFIRFMRYFCATLTLILPGFYVAITTFHHEMIPASLIASIIESKEGVPFPTTLEVLGMLLAFEILLEASLRLPKSIGATISIIGGLVIGDAAVNAKIISPAVVVVIAIAGIADFVMPYQPLSNSFRICRLLLVIASSIAGLFGLSFGIMVIVYYLSQMEVLGVPYLVPFVANEGRKVLHDTIIAVPSNKGMNDDE
ncbi:MAG: spore germination protein [Clostridia bacterium]|nr:spore germination protein [Clostridia bacterium]